MMEEIEKILEFENEEDGDGDGDGEIDIDSFPPVWLDDSSPSLPLHSRYEDMVQLEWLSHFFKDSLSKSKLVPICHAKRARSKRPRPACFNPRFSIQLLPPKKRLEQPKKRSKVQFQSHNSNKISYRKCTHCEITETPQWREGPSGPKTLCNACGVRYKKGMLFPEYRPAASPTFVPSLHSNSYRKVFEMRKSKNGDEIVKHELLQNPKSHNKGLELIECSSLHPNSHMKAMEMRKGKKGDEIVQPELLRNSKSHSEDLELIECSSLPSSNSHMKAIKLKKGKNGVEIVQPELFCNTNPHDEGLELVECPISVITTDVSSFLPEFHPAMTKSDVGLLQK